MIDDISDIIEMYDGNPENEHARLSRNQLEHEMTWRYLERYLPTPGRILEVGAASGIYTVELARRGYTVTAVDVSRRLLQRCGERLAEAGLADHARCIVADARDLSAIADRDYPVALLMGPLYHLIHEADRRLALRQVYERLEPGGILFSAHISRYGVLGELLQRIPLLIEDRSEIRSVIERGYDAAHMERGTFRGYYTTIEEIASLHESSGFQTLALAGVEPAISADDESYNRLQEPQRRLWLDLLFELSQEPSTVGASRHLLYVGRKQG